MPKAGHEPWDSRVPNKPGMILAGLLAFVAQSQPLTAHEGHDHGAPPPPVSATIAPRFEASSETHELVGVLRENGLILFLDLFQGNRPVGDAEIEVETPGGSLKAKPLGDGSYRIAAPFAATPGRYDLIATVMRGVEIDILTATLNVAAANPSAPKPGATDLAQRLPDGALFVPKPSQRILGLENIRSSRESHRASMTLPGRIIPDPNASGVVQAAVVGRISPPPGGFKRLGARVRAGDLLALVQPAVSAADLASQAQLRGEIEQQITLVSRRLERFRQISAGSITRAQVEDAELELAGLHARREAMEQTRRAPERLIAPVDGVLAAANVLAGQMADPNAILFQIIEPSRLWVEALSHGGHGMGKTGSALLPDGRRLGLRFEGAGLSERNQAVPLHFSIETADDHLQPGRLVTVHAETGESREGIALPRASVIRAANGTMLVYEQSGPERFVAREVRVEPLDASRVLVISGLESGSRIVTTGAELLHQVR